jgi:hypothetical protein
VFVLDSVLILWLDTAVVQEGPPVGRLSSRQVLTGKGTGTLGKLMERLPGEFAGEERQCCGWANAHKGPWLHAATRRPPALAPCLTTPRRREASRLYMKSFEVVELPLRRHARSTSSRSRRDGVRMAQTSPTAIVRRQAPRRESANVQPESGVVGPGRVRRTPDRRLGCLGTRRSSADRSRIARKD